MVKSLMMEAVELQSIFAPGVAIGVGNATHEKEPFLYVKTGGEDGPRIQQVATFQTAWHAQHFIDTLRIVLGPKLLDDRGEDDD